MTTPRAPAGGDEGWTKEDFALAAEIIAERREKAAESFMVAGLVREHDQDPSGWMMAGESATKTALLLEKASAALVAAPAMYEAARHALNFIQNTEGELGITLSCGDALRSTLASANPERGK